MAPPKKRQERKKRIKKESLDLGSSPCGLLSEIGVEGKKEEKGWSSISLISYSEARGKEKNGRRGEGMTTILLTPPLFSA